MNNTPELVEVGQVVGTHGLRGDLKVRLNSGDPDLLMKVDQVVLHLPAGETLHLKIARQVIHKGQVLLRFEGYPSINDAEPLLRSRVHVLESDLPELGEDEYFWGRLQGLKVIDRQYGDIGCLEDIYTTAAHDTYVVKGVRGEILIPAVKQFILDIDLDGGVVSVDLPRGLVPEES